MAYARELYAAVRDQGLAAHITFCGQRDDLRDIYAVSDAVLSLSTRPESFGRTVLEPLALGVPVVGYAHGGVAEILQALYPEGAVDVGDHDSAATRLQAVLAGDAGAPRENTRFILSRMCEDTLALYAELVASPRPQQ
jgi:glycosyltransferase involved in cell wall biosynthesis